MARASLLCSPSDALCATQRAMKLDTPKPRAWRTALSLALPLVGALAYCTTPTSGDNARTEPTAPGGERGSVQWPAVDGATVTVADAAEPRASGDSVSDGGAECRTDEDCVPAGCCHATACVAAARRPVCEGVMCTMDCRPGTLDCGGSCLCQSGRCAAQLSNGPASGLLMDAGAPDAQLAQDAAVAPRDAGRRPSRRAR
jgi:hypothetical protein